MKVIGDKSLFAFEIGDYCPDSPSSRSVDIWVGGHRLCLDDDSAYVSQYVTSLRDEINHDYDVSLFEDVFEGMTPEEMAAFVCSTREKESPNYNLYEDRLFPTYQFLDLGPTTDNIMAFLFMTGSKALLVYSLWREDKAKDLPMRFSTVRLDYEFIMSVLRQSVDTLQQNTEVEPSGSVHEV